MPDRDDTDYKNNLDLFENDTQFDADFERYLDQKYDVEQYLRAADAA